MLRLLVAPIVCAIFLASAAGIGARTDKPPLTSRIVERTVQSTAIGGVLSYAAYVPIGYDQHPKRRYPALYVLHGLPGDSSSYRSLSYLQPVLDQLHAQAIVVFPQGATDSEPDAEYLDLGSGRNWDAALTSELPGAVARSFRVLHGRAATGILGISAGGYGAATLGLHHLDLYSVVQSWSGYFHATNPDGSAPMDLPAGKTGYADLHALVASVAQELPKYPTQIGFYTGDGDPYPGFVAENVAFDRELSSANVPHRFAVYSGGHDNTLWLTHADDWLGWALSSLTPAR